jgi:hypothetical protein
MHSAHERGVADVGDLAGAAAFAEVLAAVTGALVFLANRDVQAGNDQSPDAMAAAFDAYADAVIPALAGH